MDPDDLAGRQWCEHAVPRFLPALRASIATALAQDHRLSQREIAERLGLTQAAVSHYLTLRRGRGAEPHTLLTRCAEKLADRVAHGLSGPRLTAAICGACTSYRRTEGVGPCFCVLGGVSKPDFLKALGDDGGFPKQPCETFVVERLLPFLRSHVARRLATDRGQVEVATLLGVSQPAVSHYLTGDRGHDPDLETHPVVARELDRLEGVLREGVSGGERREALCQACVQVRREAAGRVGNLRAQTPVPKA